MYSIIYIKCHKVYIEFFHHPISIYLLKTFRIENFFLINFTNRFENILIFPHFQDSTSRFIPGVISTSSSTASF